ncbi:hypothetical protein GCM10027276_34790 [Comamonas piscis]
MVLFIKPGPLNGIENRTEYGFGASGVRAQSPLQPLPERITFHKNFFSAEEHYFRSLDQWSDQGRFLGGAAQQFKRSDESFPSFESTETIDERICANMTNKEFIEEINEIKGKLIKILTNDVIPSVRQWGPATRERAIRWFGTDSERLKAILLNGYPKCVSVIKQLSGENFVKPTTGMLFECAPSLDHDGVHAAVCPIDSGHHIAIYPPYCESRTYSTGYSSKIGTILHEVCHFQTTFTSFDHVYNASLSQRLARNEPSKAINNTDSFVMFALHGVIYGNF